MVIDLFGNPRTALITFYSGAKYKVGFRLGYRKYAYNIKVTPRSSEVHNIDFNLDALRALGLKIITDKPAIYYDELYDEKAERFFSECNIKSKQVIAVNACGTWETKVWSSDYFVKLINLIGDSYNILLLWGNDREKEISEKIKEGTGSNVYMLPAAGLKELAAILKKCILLITNDTGPMHIAWVQGIKTAAIFGPTNSKLHGPRSENSVILINEKMECLGCDLTDLKKCMNEHRCMRDLTPEMVHEKIKELLIN
jgi:ADP-heptose:LPS heptosyltransferase